MSRVPFYADADALAKENAGSREFGIFMFYIGLVFVSAIILALGDKVDNPFARIIAALLLIGFPTWIAVHMKKKIDNHADELLKAEYNAAASTSGIGFMTMALMWILLERWGDALPFGGFENVANLVITVGPYIMIWMVYGNVRKKMIALSKEDV